MDDGAIAYRHTHDFDVGDPRVRAALDAFLAGEPVPALPHEERMDPAALELFAQIWALEHPDRFWPVVDREWQERQLLLEGYDGPLP